MDKGKLLWETVYPGSNKNFFLLREDVIRKWRSGAEEYEKIIREQIDNENK